VTLKKIEIIGETEEERRTYWLAQRKNFIGASEIGAVLGLNPYNSPLDVYKEKKNLIVRKENDTGFTRAGKLFEEVIAQQYAIRTGNQVFIDDSIYYNDDYPFLSCTLDRLVTTPSGEKAALECKLSVEASLWYDGPPAYYRAQVQQQILVMGLEWIDLAVVFKENERFRYFHIKRNDEFCERLVNTAKHFWYEYVQKGIPPEPTSIDDCRYLYPTFIPDAYLAVEDNPFLAEELKQLRDIRKQKKLLEKAEDSIIAKIMTLMQDREYLKYKGQNVISWRTSKDGVTVDTKLLAEKFPEIYEQVLKTKEGSRRFLFKDNLIG
jgi:putative phage-type endonuclease